MANERSRRLFVAENPIDLSMKEGENCVYVLELPTALAVLAAAWAASENGRYRRDTASGG